LLYTPDRLVPWAHLVHLSDGNERYIVFSMVGEDDALPTDFIVDVGVSNIN